MKTINKTKQTKQLKLTNSDLVVKLKLKNTTLTYEELFEKFDDFVLKIHKEYALFCWDTSNDDMKVKITYEKDKVNEKVDEAEQMIDKCDKTMKKTMINAQNNEKVKVACGKFVGKSNNQPLICGVGDYLCPDCR